MKTYPAPTQNEYKDFLIRVYFGTGPEYLRPCIRRAYLDFCRTLHGISRIPGIYQHAGSAIDKSITNLKNDSINTGQESFDDWHHAACSHLRTIYSDHGYEAFSIGQAQKWLNMASNTYLSPLKKEAAISKKRRIYGVLASPTPHIYCLLSRIWVFSVQPYLLLEISDCLATVGSSNSATFRLTTSS